MHVPKSFQSFLLVLVVGNAQETANSLDSGVAVHMDATADSPDWPTTRAVAGDNSSFGLRGMCYQNLPMLSVNSRGLTVPGS